MLDASNGKNFLSTKSTFQPLVSLSIRELTVASELILPIRAYSMITLT